MLEKCNQKRSWGFLLLFLFFFSFVFFAGLNTSVAGENEKDQWNLSDLYPTEQAWDKEVQLVENQYLPQIKIFSGKLNKPENVLKCLQTRDQMARATEKLLLYATNKVNGNLAEGNAGELLSRGMSLAVKVSAETAFIPREILAQPDNTVKSWLKRPDFKEYRYALTLLLANKPHTLSPCEEALMGKVSELTMAPENIYQKATMVNMQFPAIKDKTGKEIPLSNSNFSVLLQNPDRTFRQAVYREYYQVYNQNKETLAAILEAQVKSDVFYAKAYHYPNSLQAALEVNHIPTGVYQNLIQAVHNHLSALHKYEALRQRVLKLDQLHGYDNCLSLVVPAKDQFTYDEGKKTVLAALQCLGKDYVTDLAQGYANRWVDVYPRKNKYTGAYQNSCYDSHPYILLNFSGNLRDVVTLAHESGHAMHYYYSHQNQPYTNGDAPIFTTEVASTANELFLYDYLLKNAKDEQEKIYYFNSLVEEIKNTVYMQVMYAEFEEKIHQRVENGQGLSAASLNAIWGKLLQNYLGENYVLDENEVTGWARIPHFYQAFYVYQYATAMSAAYQLQQNIQSGKPGALERYRYFLQAGSSDDPITILKNAGVDMNSTAAVDNLLNQFQRLVDQLDAQLK